MNLKKLIVLSISGLIAGTLVRTSVAATYYQAFYGSAYYSYTPGTWKNVEDDKVCTEIREEDDFVTRTTPVKRLYLGDSTHRVFGGNSLSVGTEAQEGIVYLKAGNGIFTFPRRGLILKQGAFDVTLNTVNHDVTLNGNVSAEQPSGAKSFGFVALARSKLRFEGGTFSSTESSVLESTKCYRYNGGTSGNDTIAGLDVGNLNGGEQSLSNNVVEIASDCTGFYGTLIVTNKTESFTFDDSGKLVGWGTELRFVGETALSGTIAVRPGNALSVDSPNSALSVGTLSLSNDAMLILPQLAADDKDSRGVEKVVLGEATPFYKVTRDLQVDGVALVYLNGLDSLPDGETHVHQILSFPAASDVSEDDFKLAGVGAPRYVSSRFEIRDGGEGCKVLCLVVDPYQRLMVSDPETGVTSTEDNQVYMSALTNAASWSDGKLPRVGVSSLVMALPMRPNATVVLRTPDGKKKSTFVNTFPGRQLVIGRNAKFYMNCGEFVSTDKPLRLLNGSQLKSPNIIGAFKFTGGVEIGDGLVQMMPYPITTITIDKLTGTGEFSIAATDFTRANQGHHHFLDTTNFYGKITSVQPKWGWTKDGDLDPETGLPKYYQNIYIHDGALGGKLEVFDRAALRLGTWSHVYLAEGENSAVLVNDLNRGLTIDGFVYLNSGADVCRMEIDWPITMNGTIVKENTGTLALGGNCTMFGPNAVELPQAAWTNELQVRSGTLELKSASAIDGFVVAVAEGADVKVAYDPQNAEMLERGVNLGKSLGTPFVLEGSLDGKLPITFDFGKVSGFQGKEVGLMTVKNDSAVVAAVAAMLPEKVSIRIDGKKRKGIVRQVTSSDGSEVTFVADATISGMMLILR